MKLFQRRFGRRWQFRAHLVGMMGQIGFGCQMIEGEIEAIDELHAMANAYRFAAMRLRPNPGESILIERLFKVKED